MGRIRISIQQEKLAEFCLNRHIRKLALFGSVLRDDFRPDSDIDVLVEFEAGFVPGLEFFAIEQELSDIFGHKVELHTPKFLSPYFRDSVVEEAEDQYVAA
ncbi:MAG: nucleotidyltransferase family protein [Deltaproteobacteria bacterium]|nr:nucleotidyltransferase family protein [Deltaproteobacteria bacterium]